uniref:Strl-1 n=1 Tax=Pristionchus pacificus TaxID=54126 RepID=A0A2A6BTL0_PRIPA|eukprot:PDM69234.1 strl-1 [Pristionchus pacificus]
MLALALPIVLLQLSQGAPVMTSVTFHGITDTLKPEDEKYAKALNTAAEAFKEAEALFTDDAFLAKRGWKKETETDNGDVVYGKHTPNGKMVTVSTILEGNVNAVMTETWTGVPGLAEWNPNINYASVVAAPTEHFDIVTYGNNDVLIVSGRDFVSSRLYRPIPTGGYRMVSRSVEVDSKPEEKGKVRAHLYLAAVQFTPLPDNDKRTRCDVIMLVDLKGMLPKMLVNQVIPKIMVMDTEENVKHFKELAEKTNGHAASPGYYPVESYPLEEASVRASCTVGSRRRFDYTQCSSYEECVQDGKKTKWEQKSCHDGYAFNDGNGNCERDEKCATVENKCSIPYFRLSCAELLVCSPNNGAYIRTNCDDGFRNEFHGGCIEDARCITIKWYQNETCKIGNTRPTSNCRTYSVCEGGAWKRQQCVENGRWSEFCSECDPEYKPRECKEGDSKSTNHTEPFEGYGIDTSEIIDCRSYQRCDQGRWIVVKCPDGTGYNPSMKRCIPARLHDTECNPPVTGPRCEEGARIFPIHACARFMQCDRGEWRQMACPIGTRFEPKKNRCVEGECPHRHTTVKEKEEGAGNAEYKRGHHHHHRSSEDVSFEEFEIAQRSQQFFAQRPVEIQPPFRQNRRLNGAPEPLSSSRPLPSNPSYVPAHRPGYLGQPEPVPAVVNTGHNHHHHHERPYRPQPPQYPNPQSQPYPAAPVQPLPQPHYPSAPSYPQPAQPVYEEGTQPPRLPGLICEGDFKVADAFDSAFYYDCVHGYLKRKACPHGSRFDPQRAQCLKEYTWKPDVICYDNQVMPTAYCGEYRICRNNEWLSGICPHDWPFINGQCDKRRTCRAIATPPPPPAAPACAPGSVRPDYHNPLGYLECNYYYKWEKRNCQQGEVFDKRISRCVYTASPAYPAANPPGYVPQPERPPVCYEGELRKDGKHCTKYEMCHSGQFEPRYCPYGSGFNGYHCEQGYRCGGGTGVEGTCQESAGLRGFLPDRTDCAFFYQCAQGRWVRMPCAPGTHYSPTLGVCDHIGNVPGCGWSGPRSTHC